MNATLCVWIRTKNPVLQLKYKQRMECEGRDSIQLLVEDALLTARLHGNEWKIPASLVDDKWHHVCISWGTTDLGLLQIYIDGEIKHDENEGSMVDQSIRGGGDLDLGFIQAHVTNGIIGRISGLNVWDHMIESNEIMRMSLGCANEAGNTESWANMRGATPSKCPVILKDLSCQDREGNRLVLSINSINQTQAFRARLMSSWFNRSTAGHGKCVKFRFMLVGDGARSLSFVQNASESWHVKPTPIWTGKGSRNDDSLWQYGQVSITGTKRHQLYFEGKLHSKHGFIAVGGLYVTPGYCEIKPWYAYAGCKVFKENTTSGWVLSPQYPGYYTNNASCQWNLTVPKGHMIRLEFLFFDLEYYPRCSNDFVEIHYDRLGKWNRRLCGQLPPTIIVSPHSNMLITFKSNERVIGGGFKARYSAIKVKNSGCHTKKGCPYNCNCFETPGNLVGIESQRDNKLYFVPKKPMPNGTSIVLFSVNKIRRLDYHSCYHFWPLTLRKSLRYIDLSYNLIFAISTGVFHNMSSLETLRLNGNFLQDISPGTLSGLKLLGTLDLGDNLLSKVREDTFEDLASLRILYLQENRISDLRDRVFQDLSSLKILYLNNNQLKILTSLTFYGLQHLKILYLQDNRISHISDRAFQGLTNLNILYLNNNQIKMMTSLTFHGLQHLRILHLQNNSLMESEITQDVFKVLTNLKELKIDNFLLCCYAEKAIENLECEAVGDLNKFSSCEDMMKYPAIRTCLWLLGILALCGNLAVLIWRAVVPDNNRVQSILLSNLAMADFLMGVYMVVLAVLDTIWKGEYFKHDVSWRNSLGCRIVGAISMLSSEVSVAMLTITTADRLICVVFALKFEKLTVKAAYIICLCVWVIGTVVSILPITGIKYFNNHSSEIGFFSRSAVCLPLQLSHEKPAGWEYAAAIFIIFNFCSFLFILVAYIVIYWTMVKLVGGSASSHMQQESARVNRLFVIVLTDFCCWMPVIIMSILSLTDNFKDLQGFVYVWVAVFVLPLNSSVNPILYTLSTSYAKAKLGAICSVLFTWRKPGRVDPSVEMNNLPSNQNTNEIDVHGIPEVNHHLTLIEAPLIFQDESADNTGYIVCREEGSNTPTMALVKWFSQEREEDWEREVSMHLNMSQKGGHPCVLPYVWHSKVESCQIIHEVDFSSLPSRGWLICFQLVSSTILEAFMNDESCTLDAKLLCQLAPSSAVHLQLWYSPQQCQHEKYFDKDNRGRDSDHSSGSW
ncbi:hypothetical protein ACROYT_G001597 [Oculina patagonica]